MRLCAAELQACIRWSKAWRPSSSSATNILSYNHILKCLDLENPPKWSITDLILAESAFLMCWKPFGLLSASKLCTDTWPLPCSRIAENQCFGWKLCDCVCWSKICKAVSLFWTTEGKSLFTSLTICCLTKIWVMPPLSTRGFKVQIWTN